MLMHDIIEMSTEWPYGTGTAAITVLILVLILFLLYQAWLKAHDVLFLDAHSGTGMVIRKTFVPSRLNLEEAARVACQPTVLRAYRELVIRVGEQTAAIEIDKKTFDAVKEGGTVAIEFGITRRSNAFLLKKVIL